jgi:large subunit ribosomal protein L29
MPIIRLKDIRDLSSEERKRRVTELQTELVRLRTMTKAGGSIENTARIKELRKTIARILTIEHEAKLAAAKEAEHR